MQVYRSKRTTCAMPAATAGFCDEARQASDMDLQVHCILTYPRHNCCAFCVSPTADYRGAGSSDRHSSFTVLLVAVGGLLRHQRCSRLDM